MDDRETQDRVGMVEALLEELETLEDPRARAVAAEAVGALLELYGEGLARIMACAAQLGGPEAPEDLAQDELVSHLLLLHGLHPVAVETRVQRALEEVRPYLASHGGNVELLGVEDGVARLRLQGSCSGCPSSTVTLKLAIEEAIQKAAPDLEGIEAEGAVAPPSRGAPTFIAGPTSNGHAASSSWAVAGGLPQLSGGGLLLKEVSGEPMLFVKLEEDVFAYRHQCPGCGISLEGGGLVGSELACAGCGHRYDVRRAGRCLDAPRLYLEPIPLLVGDAGIVKVAVPGAAGAGR